MWKKSFVSGWRCRIINTIRAKTKQRVRKHNIPNLFKFEGEDIKKHLGEIRGRLKPKLVC